jgi:DNA-binding GntR family transcriptional regulator
MKVANQTLHSQVVLSITEMIEKGEIGLGQKIEEVSLAESFGVSRTPIREALRILNKQGVVELVPHKGAFVRTFSIKEIEDIFQLLAILEGTCAELAVSKMTPEDLKKIEKLHNDLERRYMANDHNAYKKASNKLHRRLMEIAGNAAIIEAIEEFNQKIVIYRNRQLYEPDRLKKSIIAHRKLLDALLEKKGKKAKTAMKRHLLAVSKAVVNLIQTREIAED